MLWNSTSNHFTKHNQGLEVHSIYRRQALKMYPFTQSHSMQTKIKALKFSVDRGKHLKFTLLQEAILQTKIKALKFTVSIEDKHTHFT